MEKNTTDHVREEAQRMLFQLTDAFQSLVSEQQWSKDPTSLEPDPLDLETVTNVIDRATHLLRQEPNVLYIPAPVVVVGDIHGQCCDLLQVFRRTGGSSLIEATNDEAATRNGSESEPGRKYLMLGDYVDRGNFSCECIMFLLALKVLQPSTVYLLRGNHESRCMTATEYPDTGINFRTECERKLGSPVYDKLMECFDSLPVCAVVHSSMGRWFCCHGGLGPKVASLEQIDHLTRHSEPPLKGALCDLLWADPLLEGVLGYKLSDKDYQEFLELDFMPNPPRGCSHLFGYAAIKPFLEENNLTGIVRAHQCKEEGISYEYTTNRKDTYTFPYITTVFSAANYCGSYGNKGAVLMFLSNRIEVIKYSSSGEVWIEGAPYVATPYGGSEVEVAAVSRPPRPKPSILLSQTRSSILWKRSLARIREGHTGEKGTSQFHAALQKDASNEIHPGWRSMQRLGRVVGRIQLLRKQVTPPTLLLANVCSNGSGQSLPQALLQEVSHGDSHQLRVVFNSIDRNQDGFLSVTELEEFAKELSVHSNEDEVQQLLQTMNTDKSGEVSFEEFTRYMATLALNTEDTLP